MKKIAFITGMTGQDGPYLAKHLLENDYKKSSFDYDFISTDIHPFPFL